ncbi:MAG TPA: hypothetical protein VGO59_16330 [Verrucomicrobiae bacterium]|jgi:hypothetical protein
MNKGRIYKVALLLVAALLFCGASQVQSRLNHDRSTLGLTVLPPLKNAPPMLAFTTVALGGFRGLIANALWIRATDMQQDDKYFEMVQLSDWITALEPHFTQVWTMQAWNMAYNISVKFKDPEDRWHWLERGIVLLRDHGIQLNPDSPLLYRELSWLFQHKMGQNLDDAHMLYKLRWAQEMQKVIGPPPNTNWMPELENPKTAAEKARAAELRDVYKMDPAIMEKVDEEYGPFDWRLPDAHAVYWAELYRQHTHMNKEDTDSLRRSIFQSLRGDCFRGGALAPSVTNVTERNFMLWPNLGLVPKINSAYEEMISEQPNSNFQNAHKNFLKEAIPLLFINNQVAQATFWFNYLKQTYTNAFVGRQQNISLQDFVVATVADDNEGTDMDRVNANLVGMYRSEFLCLVSDNDDEAQHYKQLADIVYDHYEKKIGPTSEQRLNLKPRGEIQQRALEQLLDPRAGLLDDYNRDYLRTKLGLKKPSGPETPAPSAAPAPASAPAAA